MVTIVYNADKDEISFPRTALEDDLIERNFFNKFLFFSKRKLQGDILNYLLYLNDKISRLQFLTNLHCNIKIVIRKSYRFFDIGHYYHHRAFSIT